MVVLKLNPPRFNISIIYDDQYATVLVNMDAADWKKSDKGTLYGIDISNAVYRLNDRVYAYNPSVDDTRIVRNGRKYLTLTYRMVQK